jgi:hypothetical protein
VIHTAIAIRDRLGAHHVYLEGRRQAARRDPAEARAGRIPIATEQRVRVACRDDSEGACYRELVPRYQADTDEDVDGLNETEGTFLMTSFWLVHNLALSDAAMTPRRSSIGSVASATRSLAHAASDAAS